MFDLLRVLIRRSLGRGILPLVLVMPLLGVLGSNIFVSKLCGTLLVHALHQPQHLNLSSPSPSLSLPLLPLYGPRRLQALQEGDKYGNHGSRGPLSESTTMLHRVGVPVVGLLVDALAFFSVSM